MKKIVIERLEDSIGDNRVVNKSYLINNQKICGEVDVLAVEPLRILESLILESLLMEQKIKIQKFIEGNDPWNIRELQIECDKYVAIDDMLKEIMEYRCCPESKFKCTDIIRQLPYDVMMKVSNAIMNYGKDELQHYQDMRFSDAEWSRYAFEALPLGIVINGNPNEVDDNLVIPKDEPQKRRHLIYKSMRGGYNIKTQNYRDSSMDHYSWKDSNRWD